MIDLYTAATPNGYKVSVTLEELEMDYDVHLVRLDQGEQKAEKYLAINPNGRVPTIVDRSNADFAVFESGAIMIYLAEKAGALMPADGQRRSLVMQWLMFQMANVGPMMGQANVFYRYAPVKIPYAIERYQREIMRLFGILNRRLADNEYLAGDYSIADIATFCWVRGYGWSGVTIDGLDHLERWLDAIEQRPAVRRGLKAPPPPDVEKNSDKLIESTRKFLA